MNRPGPEVDCSFAFMTQVKKEKSYASTPLYFLKRDNFNIANNQGCIASNDWTIFNSELDSSERKQSRGTFLVFFCGTEKKNARNLSNNTLCRDEIFTRHLNIHT